MMPPAPGPGRAAGLIQRKCACGGGDHSDECEECTKKQPLQRMASGNASAVSPIGSRATLVSDALRTSGQPLPTSTRSFMEHRFGHDFSRVRVHADRMADRSAQLVDALAFTVGEHIVFRAGLYDPESTSGRRLLAHELTHVLQQRGAEPAPQARLEINTPGDVYEQEAERTAGRVMAPDDRRGRPSGLPAPGLPAPARVAALPRPLLQRQCPTAVNFTSDPAHVPSCGPVRATTDVPTAARTWSLAADTAAVDPGTVIANANGAITIANTQPAGEIKAVATATDPALGGCSFENLLRIRSHPTAITTTTEVAGPPAGDYGAVFDHVFESADGNVASLDNVGVGERFTNVPNPPAANHAVIAPLFPFGGTFNFHTATLEPNASNNWFLTAAGELGGNHDNVTIGQAGINVGRFIQSASRPTPTQGLPAGFTLLQRLHWFCPQRPAATRWIGFLTVAHSRTLRNNAGALEFVTTVNGVEHVDPYVGETAVFNLTASPASTPRSAGPPVGGGAAPAPRTVRITADTLPAALPAALTWSMHGPALGCAVAADPADDHAADLTIGVTAGTVRVQAADTTGVNFARVAVVIT
jgi:Domain of unknown function (DUF4157)